jgi:hypothetical protein
MHFEYTTYDMMRGVWSWRSKASTTKYNINIFPRSTKNKNKDGIAASQTRLTYFAGYCRRSVLKGAHRTWLGRVHRSGGRCRRAIAHRVVWQGLGRPAAGQQRATKSAAVGLAPLLLRRFCVRFEQLFVLLLLTQVENIIGQDAQGRHPRAVVRQLVTLVKKSLADSRNVKLLLQLQT